MAKPKNDEERLPPARAAAQKQRETLLLDLLGGTLKPSDLLPARQALGLVARLSSHERATLRSIGAAGTSMKRLNRDHVARLTVLELVWVKGTEVGVTSLGKQRMAQPA